MIMRPLSSQTESVPKGENEVERALLYAKFEGYSQLQQYELAIYAETILADISKIIDHPEAKNSWGDELLCVYRNPEVCCNVALELRDYFRDFEWTARGMRNPLQARILLHSTRVFIAHDPIRNDKGIFANVLSRTARIAEACAANEVFCLEAMQPLTAALDSIKLDSIENRQPSKGRSSEKIYRLRRESESSYGTVISSTTAQAKSDLTIPIGSRISTYFGQGVVEDYDPEDEQIRVQIEDGRAIRICLHRAVEWLEPTETQRSR